MFDTQVQFCSKDGALGPGFSRNEPLRPPGPGLGDGGRALAGRWERFRAGPGERIAATWGRTRSPGPFPALCVTHTEAVAAEAGGGEGGGEGGRGRRRGPEQPAERSRSQSILSPGPSPGLAPARAPAATVGPSPGPAADPVATWAAPDTSIPRAQRPRGRTEVCGTGCQGPAGSGPAILPLSPPDVRPGRLQPLPPLQPCGHIWASGEPRRARAHAAPRLRGGGGTEGGVRGPASHLWLLEEPGQGHGGVWLQQVRAVWPGERRGERGSGAPTMPRDTCNGGTAASPCLVYCRAGAAASAAIAAAATAAAPAQGRPPPSTRPSPSPLFPLPLPVPFVALRFMMNYRI
uniref:Uncharacterized protein LOC110199708 n=1 Tax=Phascolarctos cinereus TaxID=38626 RepID=A0A6P5J7Y0_PHACI|nr:uncharacterized protein LOC110199708 [Phascolarctos cinereus]